MSSFLKKASKKVFKNISGEEVGCIAATAGIAFMRSVVIKKGVSTNMKFLMESWLFNETENKNIPEKTMKDALAIKDILTRYGVVLERIAIDGVPGSGKSSLSRAIGKVFEMTPISLDHFNMDKNINFISKPAVFEHHRLLRTQDIDCFDVIIYIDEPVNSSKEKILHRKRGSYLVDIMNFELMKKIGRKAFSLADGIVYPVPDSFIKIKIRSGQSYNVMSNLADELKSLKFNINQNVNKNNTVPDQILTMAKESQIFLLEEGKAKKGFTAYLNHISYKKEFMDAFWAVIGIKNRLPWNLSGRRNS